MSLRSVLIVAYHFAPSAASGSFRMVGFARHLPRHGWRALVVAPPELPSEPVDPDLLRRVPPETAIYHVPYLKSRIARRLVPISGWLPRAARACRAAIRTHHPAAVLTSGPPHQTHWLGLWLKTRYGLPWIADFRDPWFPEGRADRGQGFAAWKVGVQEAAVFRAADAVIANAPGALEVLRRTYPHLGDRFVTLPNGYDRETFADLVASRRSRPSGSTVRVVHAGAIYAGRDPRPFLDAVQTLVAVQGAGAPPLEVDFYGPPAETGIVLDDEVRGRGLDGRVRIHGQVPYARALQAMAGADILLLMDSPGRTVGVPAKLYEYIGAERPVLALGARAGDVGWVLAESGIPHRIAPPDDAGAIARALTELSQPAVDLPTPPADPHRFSRESITGELALLLNRVAPAPLPRREDES